MCAYYKPAQMRKIRGKYWTFRPTIQLHDYKTKHLDNAAKALWRYLIAWCVIWNNHGLIDYIVNFNLAVITYGEPRILKIGQSLAWFLSKSTEIGTFMWMSLKCCLSSLIVHKNKNKSPQCESEISLLMSKMLFYCSLNIITERRGVRKAFVSWSWHN